MILEVYYRDQLRVGRLAEDRAGGKIYFQYDVSWLEKGIELSPWHLPTSQGQKLVSSEGRDFQGLFGVFADSLPFGWGRKLLNRHLQTLGINPHNASILTRLSFLGDHAMGALSYRPVSDAGSTDTTVKISELDKEAQAFSVGAAEGKHLSTLIAAGMGAGGARPKVLALVSGDDIRLGVREQDGWEPYLIKLTDADHVHGGRIEYAYAKMALAAGLPMPPVRLFQGRYFGVKRFDRSALGKIHQHTLGGLLQEVASSYDDLGRAAVDLTRDLRVLEDVFRRAAFNVGALIRDDHVLNVAFLMRETEGWRLAPCYDLTPNDPARIPSIHSMSVNGSDQPRCRDLLAMGKEFGLSNAKTIVEQVRAALIRWNEFADEAAIEKSIARELAKRLSEGRLLG